VITLELDLISCQPSRSKDLARMEFCSIALTLYVSGLLMSAAARRK